VLAYAFVDDFYNVLDVLLPHLVTLFKRQIDAPPLDALAPVATVGKLSPLEVPGLALARAIWPFANAFAENLFDFFNAH
jgi:hypothetical protein